MSRFVLAHVNVEVPDDVAETAEALAVALEREIIGAIHVGTDPDHTPILSQSEVEIPLIEEI